MKLNRKMFNSEGPHGYLKKWKGEVEERSCWWLFFERNSKKTQTQLPYSTKQERRPLARLPPHPHHASVEVIWQLFSTWSAGTTTTTASGAVPAIRQLAANPETPCAEKGRTCYHANLRQYKWPRINLRTPYPLTSFGFLIIWRQSAFYVRSASQHYAEDIIVESAAKYFARSTSCLFFMFS